MPKAKTTTELNPSRKAEWMTLLAEAMSDHWRHITVQVRFREWLAAGKPAQLDAAQAMIKARGLGDVLEARMELVTDPTTREALAEEVMDDGLCEFHRRDKPGLWFPANNIKAGLKENWSVLGLRVEHRGSRGALAEGTFVYAAVDGDPADRDWIYLGPSDPPPLIHTAVAHTTGPRGPRASIKRFEYLVRPEIGFVIAIAKSVREKLPDADLARTLAHFAEHGLGANRSQGYGRFDVLGITEE